VTLAVQRDLDELRTGLARWLGRAVETVARPAPGWSCETLIVDGELVVRLPPVADGIFPTYDLAQQAAVQEAVGQGGVPVAGPARYEPDPSFLGAPFIAMPFVTGPIPGEFTPADEWLLGLPDDGARRSVWRSFLDALVAIHQVSPHGLGLRTGLADELAFWDTYLTWATDGTPPPALADALAWCAAHRPPDEPPPTLLWGDVRLGNVVYDGAALAPKAVLDWDMVSAGPTEMDVAWFLALEALQTDLTHMSVPGFGSREEAVALVEQGIGRPLVALEWHEVFALVRASAVSTRIAILFERAGQRSMFKLGQDPTLAAAVARIEAW
jgi:aminoglycoside phosphotransferase (APT) family kinase protein